ncbi:hypothetical protein [Burkholderia alba]|uniref:hypothetical protein n=1 Tax=Burkholderia alba TaxID=2683677 RepID=UPI002B05443C|nr:hypothetical protein [Burkholderia alba]
MNTAAAIADLRTLASSDQRPAAARLRDLFDEVQAATVAGVRRATIRDSLARNGLDMSFATFVRTLARIRKERGIVMRQFKTAGRAAVTPAPASLTTTRNTQPSPDPVAVVVPLAPAPSIAPTSAAVRVCATITPAATLPDDWLTSDTLTPEQLRLLTMQQRIARGNAYAKRGAPDTRFARKMLEESRKSMAEKAATEQAKAGTNDKRDDPA